MADYGKWHSPISLSEGGQAHTFLVHTDSEPGIKYVLKRLKNIGRLPRFQAEVEACMILDHLNIIRIVDHSFDAKRPYMVTEYCSKGPLADIDLAQFSLVDKLRLFWQICEGVAHAHEKGITHRDIKPENIFLRGDGTPVVGDFGICFIEDNGERFTLTEEAAGPRLYIAPELEDGRVDAVRPCSDVYSLGKVLYWLLTGKVFAREKHHEAQYDLAIISPSSESFLINEFLDNMIVASPGARYQTAGQVLPYLRQLIHRIRTRAHAINLNAPQPCDFCGIGEYKRVVDYQNEVSGSPTDVRNFGFSAVSGCQWLIFVCNHCGNTQIFRPDYLRNKNPWR